MEDCLFCKIISGEIPSTKVYEDDLIYAFNDVNPQAPVHFLVVPKKHIASLDATQPEDAEVLGYILTKIKEIAKAQGITNGYRVAINCGEDGDQTVQHLHFHVLGKRKMSWPPG